MWAESPQARRESSQFPGEQFARFLNLPSTWNSDQLKGSWNMRLHKKKYCIIQFSVHIRSQTTCSYWQSGSPITILILNTGRVYWIQFNSWLAVLNLCWILFTFKLWCRKFSSSVELVVSSQIYLWKVILNCRRNWANDLSLIFFL